MQVFTGVVCWFNKKRGFGFVKIIDKDLPETDTEIFCHYTAINSNTYRALFPGEFVNFNIVETEEKGKVCSNVTGINGYPLLIDNETHT